MSLNEVPWCPWGVALEWRVGKQDRWPSPEARTGGKHGFFFQPMKLFWKERVAASTGGLGGTCVAQDA